MLADLPESSTTGSADTRLSTKMLSALMMGVSGWMKAMSRYVPMPSSLSVCFMNAGFGISHIWKRRKHRRRQGCVFHGETANKTVLALATRGKQKSVSTRAEDSKSLIQTD